MVGLKKQLAGVLAGSGAALLVCTGLAQPAAAAVPYPGASFYAAAGQSGTEFPVDLSSTACQTLPQAARSAVNLSGSDIVVYFNPDCAPGTPGSSGDTTYVLGSLHSGDFPFPAVSYRVVTH
ncbi:hypothetical protein ABZ707_31175 [Streptomyces sp. NPDC006923]|uniref:hypothetical protein n=1 Tax=Streptomyces sp. NPDC006923 TaxID=3155355 RepID=UPI003407859F